MLDCILDGFLDTLKLFPYLFITFLLLEFIEHKVSVKSEKLLKNNKRFGPVFGGILGGLPQCGFSTIAAELYSFKMITMGTVIAVFLSTSDEMLPIMLSEKVPFFDIFEIIIIKVIIGIIVGFLVDVIYRKKIDKYDIHNMCEKEHCDCSHDGVFLSSLKHTIKILTFILIANIILNSLIFVVGEDTLKQLLLHDNIIKYFVASIIGLIPNCASSVIMTELYLAKLISIGTLFAGLLTGSGLGILLLFKNNDNKRENILILSIIYFVGVMIGLIFDIIV